MKFADSKYEVIGKNSGCNVIEVPTESVVDFYETFKDRFEPTASRSFLKAMRIPPGFFLKQPANLQKDLLVAQQGEAREHSKEFLLLFDEGNRVQYVGPKGKFGCDDPLTILSEDGTGWKCLRTDFRVGYQRFITDNVSVKDRNDYTPAVFANVPILYMGQLRLNVGMYKVICSNGMIDAVSVSTIRLGTEAVDRPIFSSIVSGIRKAVLTLDNTYGELLKSLKGRELTSTQGREVLTQMMNSKVCPKTLLKSIEKHIDLLAEGGEVPKNSPKSIENEYDLLDAATFYSQDLPSVTSQERAESGVFRYLYENHAGDGRSPKLPLVQIPETLALN